MQGNQTNCPWKLEFVQWGSALPLEASSRKKKKKPANGEILENVDTGLYVPARLKWVPCFWVLIGEFSVNVAARLGIQRQAMGWHQHF